MQTITRQIFEEQQRLENELNKEDPTLQFYQEFFEKYRSLSMDGILKIDRCDLIVALLAAEENAQSIDTIKDFVYSNHELFENIDYRGMIEIFNLIVEADYADVLPEVSKRLYEGIRTKRFYKLFNEESRYTEKFAEIAESYGTTPKNFVKVIKYIVDEINKALAADPDITCLELGLGDAIAYCDALREFEEDQQRHREEIAEVMSQVNQNKINERAHSRIMRNLAKDEGWQIGRLLDEVNQVRQYYDKINDKDRNRRKGLSREKTLYDNLLSKLYNDIELKDKEIQIPEKLLSKIKNSEIKKSALRVIYNHNIALCDKKEAEYLEVTANDTTQYQLLLANYGISPSQYEVGTILNHSLAETEAILKGLTKFNIKEPNLLLSLVQVSDLDTIKEYASLAEKGIITSNLLIKHPNLLDSRSKEYENMMRNLATVKKHSINPHYFTETEEVLITSNKKFSHNIETLEDYQLIPNMKMGMNTTFLSADDLTASIDTLLELGFESILESSPDILNYRDKFARLRILKELNIPVASTEELLAVLTTDKFYVPDSMISDYIYNAVDYNLPEDITPLETPKKKSTDISKLEEFSKTPRTYDFDGVTISKNRVARNLNELKQNGNVDDRLVYGILKGATLNDEEVAKIKSTLGASKSNAPIK